MRRSSNFLAMAGALLGLCTSACSDAPGPIPEVADVQAPIVNGSVDNSGNYEDVVAVFGNMSKCTGTIIDKQEPYAFVLSAAHCFDDGAPQIVVQGRDHDSQSAITYNVQDYAIHPQYNGSVNDFAMIRVTGAGPSTPTRDVLSPAEDNLGFNSQVTHLGYGVINPPEGGTSVRHITTGRIIADTSLTLTFDASSSGVCFGDSGGPNIDNTSGKVAGVNHAVSGNSCNGESYSGRASAVLNTFITPFINNAPPPPVNCDGCFEAATTGNGSCMSAVNACFNNSTCNALIACFNDCSSQSCINQCAQTHSAGMPLYNAIFDCVCDSACATECEDAAMCNSGTTPPATSAVAQSSVAADAAATSSTGVGGGTGTGGAGGTGASTGSGDNGFYAGNEEDINTKGIIQVTQCTIDAPGSGKSTSWLWLGVAGLGLMRRRRRSMR